MPSLLASLNAAAGSMRTFERALATVQNNVSNASTPGYARQQADLVAQAFHLELELPGGVAVSDLVSARDEQAERAVRRQSSRHGRLAQLAASLAQIEPILDIGEGSGVAGALDRLFRAFSQLSVTPNDMPARNNVIGRAGDVAAAFRRTAASLLETRDQANRELRAVVEQINRLAHTIRDINVEIRSDRRKLNDAGLDARLNAALEELSELVDFEALRADDGSVTVFIGGQGPLVMGASAYELQADFSGAQTAILDHTGQTVTGLVREGRLAGLLEVVNQTIPAHLASLNQLAQTLADRINSILAAGVDLNGQPPAVNLFTYNPAAGAAYTLAVTAITGDQIAAAYPSAPGGNENALDLAALANSIEINGTSFTGFYGWISSQAGQALASARAGAQAQSSLVVQARNLRAEVSGVNLDEEAAAMIQYQRAYQAAAKLIAVLDELTQATLAILPR
jgi:flagellar hook-associated protein 1 FlgK